MKKTVAAILLIASLAIAIALPSFAADTIYFTSVNNILMTLSDDTMPINYNGSIYVPYSVFNSNELGTFAVYSQSAQIVTVFGSGVQLYFNLQEGATYDTYGTSYQYRAISSNGRVYLPAAFTCQYFGIDYSTIQGNRYGPIVRMTVGNVLDNATFSAAASELMKSRLDDYNRTKASSSPSASSTPPPTPTPARPSPPSSSSAPDRSDVDVYVSFFGLDQELTPRILNSLKLRSVSAAFFVTAGDISACPDLIRRISGEGHMIGIICGEDAAGDYAAASTLLFDAAHTAAFITTADYGEAAAELGLVPYCAASQAQPLSLSACLKALDTATEREDLIFTTDEQTADDLPSLLRTLRNENYTISRLTETRAAEYGG